MALSRSGLTKFFGRSAGEAAGFAFGHAAAPALAPPIQELVNNAWHLAPFKVVDVLTLAEGVAQGQVDKAWATEEAQRNGFDNDRFLRMVSIANVGPGTAAAFEMWRRKVIDEDGFRKAVKRIGLEPEWIDDLVALHNVLLGGADIANAVQQGHIPNEGILPDVSAGTTPAEGAVDPDTPDGRPPSHVPLTTIDLSPTREAQHHGITLERLKIMANLAGLPPGPEALLSMWNRGLIDEDSVDAGIREGHMKTKWTGAFKRMRWAVLSGQEYAEARLRDWITDREMYAGGALTGHTKSQMDLYYKNRGRTATPRQVWLGWARKVVAPDYPDDPANGRLTGLIDHERAIRRSNIRPEYAKLLWDVRFNYPPLFQLNRLVQAGAIDADLAAKWASYNLEAPEVVAALKQYWNQGSGTTSKGLTATDLANEYEARWITRAQYVSGLKQIGYADAVANRKADAEDSTRARKARDQRITLIGARYIAHQIGRDRAVSELDGAQVPARVRDSLLVEWDAQRALTPDALTPAQIKKAWYQVRMTRPEAVARLEFKGYDAADAEIYLDE